MKNSYFGIASLFLAILSVIFLGANIGVSQLNITPETFNSLNYMTALAACSLAPLAVVFGVLGFFRKNDSQLLAGIALILVGIPFLILLVRMIFSIMKSN